MCDKYENKLITDDDYNSHIKRKNCAQDEKKVDKERAKVDHTFHTCAFDTSIVNTKHIHRNNLLKTKVELIQPLHLFPWYRQWHMFLVE